MVQIKRINYICKAELFVVILGYYKKGCVTMKSLMYVMAFAAMGGIAEGEGGGDNFEDNDITNTEVNEIEFREDYPIEEDSVWKDHLNNLEDLIPEEQEIFEV